MYKCPTHKLFYEDGDGCPACIKGSSAKSPLPAFPGTAGMYASQHRLAVTEEWMRGWNACLDAIDRLGGFRHD